jgi:hypothetical protein
LNGRHSIKLYLENCQGESFPSKIYIRVDNFWFSLVFIKKIIKLNFFKKNWNQFKSTGFGSVRFFRTKTRLAQFFRFCSVFSVWVRFCFRLIKPNRTELVNCFKILIGLIGFFSRFDFFEFFFSFLGLIDFLIFLLTPNLY